MLKTRDLFQTTLKRSAAFFYAHLYELLFTSLGLVVFIAPVDFFFWNNQDLRVDIILNKSMGYYRSLEDLSMVYFNLVLFLFLIAIFRTIHTLSSQSSYSFIKVYQYALKEFFAFVKIGLLYFLGTLVWGLLLIIPGLVFAVKNSFAILSKIIEDKDGEEALLHSRIKLKGQFNRFLDSVLFIIILLIGVYLPFMVMFEFLMQVQINHENYMAARIVEYVHVVVRGLVWLYFYVFFYMLYQELPPKELKVENIEKVES